MCYNIRYWPYRLSVRTPAFHAGKRSSTLRGVTEIKNTESKDSVFLISVSLGLKNWKFLVEDIRLFSEFQFKIREVNYA